MNPIAYRTTNLVLKTFANLTKARVVLHDTDHIPEGANIFVVNHFTRLETVLIPFYLHNLLQKPIWSLASKEFFVGAIGRFLDAVGAVSTNDPHRDRLIVKTLLTGEADWIIFPEGRMVKNKKIVEKGRFIVSSATGKHAPHTGAANLALRTEFYRQRLLWLTQQGDPEAQRLLSLFRIDGVSQLSSRQTHIVPVNLTYYPLRARINILNKLAKRLMDTVPERLTEELMTEGAMLLSGVDIDLRFGRPIAIDPWLRHRKILRDIRRPQSIDFDDRLSCLKLLRKNARLIMQHYMGAIYGLTTVNHDHIFASLLKHSLHDRIHVADLLRRAFLAIQQGTAEPAIHLHTSLQENQNHLLLDDRFQQLADFISVAQETEVVQHVPPYLIRNRRKLKTFFDFHRARIDNPVAVMANEVEPLNGLQKRVSRLCRTPRFWLQRRIFRWFLDKGELEFETDYRHYAIDGESKPRDIGHPLLIRGRSRQMGILLCHGYMAAPAEVQTLAEYLGAKGYWVHAPRLKGHGTAPEDLARCTYMDWIRSVEEGYLLIRNRCRRVAVGGFSTGAALALELAARIDGLAGVFAVATPLRLQYAASKLAPVVDAWNRFMGKMRWEEARKLFVENHPENPEINYLRNPISGVRELERLMDRVEPLLGNITIPALVVQADEDPVVNPKGSERIFQRIGSADKRYVLFHMNRHGILRGEGSSRVHHLIGGFVDQLRDNLTSRSGSTDPGS
ncbi:alpha/beta fold hydrolase [Desulfatitalea alkaliphila]|uniref:Alpha/beta fold hydrolase n=1 Tax=Desulfatitalea alkaliphila TaxID=2929485 RepID=A0AA41R419_9BACT|nr:alpha/beta fold hydrolase [Desulfatitalea alkaliphila]MCJ8500620.1 alpha/beta fold hydrolase [Desulfatitalea alkaliphila]